MTPQSIVHIPVGSPWWVFAIVVGGLFLHIGGGSVGILSGYAAVTARKGERLHRRFGTVFLLSMLTMAMAAISLAIWNQQRGNTVGGILALYLVATAWMTVRRRERQVALFERVALVAILGCAVVETIWGLQAARSPKGALEGVGPVFYFVFAFFASLFAALDLKVILQGGVSGAQRIARHLWRMCFALFFAAASFFLGQQKVMPKFMHGSPVLLVLGLAPLAFMIFWLLRVWLTKQFRTPALAS